MSAPPLPFSVPDRIHTKTPRYWAWSGNLKEEWRRQFDEFFALTVAAKRLFPKTPEVAESLAYLAGIEQRFPRR